ncbi:MAG: hypothetical protein ACJAZB_000124 [Psychrosphaera sp.]|jgi:hypothetical protein|uniref:DUF2970 domain-containing protein n=1 Tax=Psychrosphaera aquimarina TaxID=2044854 RepID=A0ABU3R2J5_9GAMM|nr:MULTISPECIES: DUF2970 domain-containing protein [Psychrosphaera]MBU2919259.1 DUF2970 domain-containing protein [Psychrosphaera sp. F3M07]MDU0113901.1 DUF2970 domain-containing protein [Psychrosphaera aquimarina]
MSKINVFINAFKSAFSALLGVQNSNNHKQDFESETPFPFILAGVILVIGFILILVAIVSAVLP